MSSYTVGLTLVGVLSAGIACKRDEVAPGTENTTGNLQVSTVTTGQDVDADGYTLVLDARETRSIGINDQLAFPELPAGDHSVRLDDVALNCHVTENPRTLDVPAGGDADATFSVTCTSETGEAAGLRITDQHFLLLDGDPVALFGMGNFWALADPGVDFADMIDTYAADGSNLMRMSAMAHTVAKREGLSASDVIYPFQRVAGAETGNDGAEKFDVQLLNDAWFNRLEDVVAYAANRKVVIILLLWDEIPLESGEARWEFNPYNPDNNVNELGLSANLGSDGDPRIEQFYDLANAALLESQERVVGRILETIKSYGNVIIGISNEYTGGPSWHRHWHEFVQDFESSNPGSSIILTNELEWREFSPTYTDLISFPVPGDEPNWRQNRPVVNYRTQPQWDRDLDGARRAFWYTFMTGGHTSDDSHDGDKPPDYHHSPQVQSARAQIRIMRDLLDRLPVNQMLPELALGDICSGGANSDATCRAKPGSVYVAYLPTGGVVEVDLTAVAGSLQYEWLDPRGGQSTGPEYVQGGDVRSFSSPFDEAVLYIH